MRIVPLSHAPFPPRMLRLWRAVPEGGSRKPRPSDIRKQFWLCRGGKEPRIGPKSERLIAGGGLEAVDARVAPRWIGSAETASNLEPWARLGEHRSAATVTKWRGGLTEACRSTQEADDARLRAHWSYESVSAPEFCFCSRLAASTPSTRPFKSALRSESLHLKKKS